MGIYMKIGWKPLEVHNILSIYNNICNSNNNKHRKVNKVLDYKWREWKQNIIL
jgi:hypothetical protein